MAGAPITPPSKPTVETLEQRLDGMAEAVKLLQEYANRMPTADIVDGKVDALRELTDTRFNALRELINTRFDGNKTALDAALKTQRDVSDKLESNYTKQIENIVANIQTLTKSFDDKITDVKDRFNASEGRGVGRGDFLGWIVALVAIAVGVSAMITRLL